ncbi:MAG: FlgD immunoglobulin-like domain containing protein [bacterium]
MNFTRKWLVLFLTALICAVGYADGAVLILDDDMVVVSSAASPRVAYGISHQKDNLMVAVAVSPFDAAAKDPAISLQVGLSADNTLTLTDKDASVRKNADGMVYEFKVPEKNLANTPEAWDKLRMAIAVTWNGGAFGQPRQRETFLQGKAKSSHGGLAAPENWQLVNLAEFEKALADRRLQIAFDFTQPMEGIATIVIDDEKGNRVRNLISGQIMAKGKQRIVWDGKNESGVTMPPGKYNWRAISLPGLKPNYQFSFCNGPGSNHGTFHAAASNSKFIFFGTPVSEGGYELVQLDPTGKMVHGFNSPNGHGLSKVAVSADEKYLYAAYDGSGWGEQIDRSKPDWKANYKISLVRFDLETGNSVNFGRSTMSDILVYPVGPGSPDKTPDTNALAGLTYFNGHLYMANRIKNEVMDIDPATGTVTRSFPLDKPVALASSKDALYGISDSKLVQIDPEKGAISKEIATPEGKPAGLAMDADGKFYVSDGYAHVVRIIGADGKAAGMIGKLGGLTYGSFDQRLKTGGYGETFVEDVITAGPYDPLRMQNPAGLTISPDGHLWVTENGRWTPKRLASYDAKTGAIWKEFFGPTAYGADGCAFDPADSTHWIGQGTLFKLDFKTKTAKPIAILGGETGRSYRFWRQEGRTFVISVGKATYIQELLPNNSLKPLAMLSSGHQFCYANNWNPPAAFITAFNRDYPAQKYVSGIRGTPNHGFGMIWVDKDGDGKMSAEEIEFSTAADYFGGSGWGHDFYDLTLRVPATYKGKSILVAMKPEGWWPGGAPKYPAINDAVKAGIAIDGSGGGVETTVDRFGNMIVNSDPVMRSYRSDGTTLWSYPNKWSNVHGSHAAPLPTAGELQGVLFYTGVAPLDDKTDIIAMNGNHGREFFITSDGLYIDEMFPDCRLMTNPQAGGIGILGGECFGGTFGKSLTDGNYYFQGGGIEYRIYRVDGMRDITRSNGTFTVTSEQAIAAERNQSRVIAEKAQPCVTTIPYMKIPVVIDGKSNDWTGDPTAQWNRGNQFPVTVRASHDDKNLYMLYTVKDGSPWVNNGKDWQMLFKTGDSIDLQLGTDPKANPKRTGPVAGDLRLLIAPFQGGNIAVLYRHRLKGATDSVVFQCPWRNEKVDSVKKLDSAQIVIARAGDSYNVEAAVPLSELGLDAASFGKQLRGDLGIIYGDADGTTNIYRNYWSNQATALINDVPGEIMLTPNMWGDITLEAAQ